jgi:hypothetical protein
VTVGVGEGLVVVGVGDGLVAVGVGDALVVVGLGEGRGLRLASASDGATSDSTMKMESVNTIRNKRGDLYDFMVLVYHGTILIIVIMLTTFCAVSGCVGEPPAIRL